MKLSSVWPSNCREKHVLWHESSRSINMWWSSWTSSADVTWLNSIQHHEPNYQVQAHITSPKFYLHVKRLCPGCLNFYIKWCVLKNYHGLLGFGLHSQLGIFALVRGLSCKYIGTTFNTQNRKLLEYFLPVWHDADSPLIASTAIFNVGGRNARALTSNLVRKLD